MEEIWKDIKGYEGRYQISNFGRVKSLIYPKEKIMNIYNFRRDGEKGKGYWRVRLIKNSSYKYFFVHRLVAEAFIPNPNNYATVNHINGDKTDNRAENLEWCTQKENINHAWETGLVDKEKKIENMRKLGLSKIGLVKRWGKIDKEIIGVSDEKEN